MDDQATPPGINKTYRRRHTKAVKEQVLAECQQPGISVSSVALRHGINQNLIYKWRHQLSRKANDTFLRLPAPVALPPAMPADSKVASVRMEVPTSSGPIIVHWPINHITHSIEWLKAVMR